MKLACGGLRDESDLRGHNRTWKAAQPGWILRELRRVRSKDPVFVLDEIDKLCPDPAAVLLEVLDPAQHRRFRDAYVELPFDLSNVLFLTTANDTARIPPALRDRLEVIDLPAYTEDEKLAIAATHLVPAQNRAAGLTATPVRFTPAACRRIIRDYTNEPGVRQLARCLYTVCRKAALAHETGGATRVPRCITARGLSAWLGEPAVGRAVPIDRLRAQLGAPATPSVVRERGHEVVARLSLLAPTDPEHARARAYLQYLVGMPWASCTGAPLDLERVRAVLDAGHAGCAAMKEHLVDYLAVCLAHPVAAPPILCLLGPPGVGKSALARLVAAALGRRCAWVACAEIGNAAALRGTRAGPPGRIAEELRRAGTRNPVFVLDEIDRLDDAGGVRGALLELVAPAPGAAFRDHYLDLPLDLSDAVFVATANSLRPVPRALGERMRVLELHGYTHQEKRVVAVRHLLPEQLQHHGLTAGQVLVTDAAVDALVRGYTHQAGVWDLHHALARLCARLVRRRIEEGDTPVEVTPETVVEMLGPPEPPDAAVRGRTGCAGVALGLARTAHGGDVICIEANRMPGSGELILTGRQGEVTRESARTALTWLRANAGRYGLDPAFYRNTDVHLHVPSGRANEGPSAGAAMVAALASAFTGRPVCADLALTGEITLAGRLLPVGAVPHKLLAAHRHGLVRVLLPRQNEKEVREDLSDELRRALAIHYVASIDELLSLTLRLAPRAVVGEPIVEPAARLS